LPGTAVAFLQAYCRVHKAGNYSKWDIKIMPALTKDYIRRLSGHEEDKSKQNN